MEERVNYLHIDYGAPMDAVTIKAADRTGDAKLAALTVRLMEVQELLASAQTLLIEVTDALNGNEPVGW